MQNIQNIKSIQVFVCICVNFVFAYVCIFIYMYIGTYINMYICVLLHQLGLVAHSSQSQDKWGRKEGSSNCFEMLRSGGHCSTGRQCPRPKQPSKKQQLIIMTSITWDKAS